MNKKKVSLPNEHREVVSNLIVSPLQYAIIIMLTSFPLINANTKVLTFDNEDSQSELDSVDISSIEFIKFLEFARNIVKNDSRFICQFLENYFDEYLKLRDVDDFSPSFKCFVSLYEELCYLLPESEQSGFVCPEEGPSSLNSLSSSFIDLLCLGTFIYLGLKLFQVFDFSTQYKSKERRKNY